MTKYEFLLKSLKKHGYKYEYIDIPNKLTLKDYIKVKYLDEIYKQRVNKHLMGKCPEKGVIKNINREWEKRDHALFVGYAPIEDPKYAISVVVEHGGSGSGMAAPIARDIFRKLFNV